jgi:hypothetical protein
VTEPVSSPALQPALKKEAARNCPKCGQAGRSVARATMRHLLNPECLDRMEEGDYRFCANPDCRVVYFAESAGRIFTTEALQVRVGLKEREDPIPICYCFGHTVASARDEIIRTGRSTVVASITAEIKAGRCACETTNPAGSCCLGDVSKAVKELMKEQAALAKNASVAALASTDSIITSARDCCAPAK